MAQPPGGLGRFDLLQNGRGARIRTESGGFCGAHRPSLLDLGDLRFAEICSNWNLEWNLGVWRLGYLVPSLYSRPHNIYAAPPISTGSDHPASTWSSDRVSTSPKMSLTSSRSISACNPLSRDLGPFHARP
jgi:hypothetical protein